MKTCNIPQNVALILSLQNELFQLTMRKLTHSVFKNCKNVIKNLKKNLFGYIYAVQKTLRLFSCFPHTILFLNIIQNGRDKIIA